MRSIPKMGAVVLLATVLTACGGSSSSGGPTTETSSAAAVSNGGPVHDHVSLVDNLRRRGVMVEITGSVTQPFFRPRGTQLRLTGGGLAGPTAVESYNYDSTDLGTDGAQAAKNDAARIGPDGMPKTGAPSWTGPAHFFRSDRVLVLYVGSDPAAVSLLTALMGPQFAGR